MIRLWRRPSVLAAALTALSAVLLLACSAERSGVPPITPSARSVTVDEAESLLHFDVKLPSFLPEATAPTPALYVVFDEEGQPDWLEAMFWERDTAREKETGLRIRIMQSPGDMSLLGDWEEVEIGGASVQLEVHNSRSEIIAGWTQAGIGFDAEFVWLQDGHAEGAVTREMRSDALKVIRSMIEPDP